MQRRDVFRTLPSFYVEVLFMKIVNGETPLSIFGKNSIADLWQGHNCNLAQKLKFSIKDFFSKCDQIRSSISPDTPEICFLTFSGSINFLPHLLKKSLMENLVFCAANISLK